MAMTLSEALALVDREMAADRFAPALDILTQLDRQCPDSADILRRLGFCLARLGDVPAGIAVMRRVVAAGDPAGPVLLDMLTNAAGLPPTAWAPHLTVECFRHTVYMDYPKTVTLETFASCNAKCGFCPHATMPRRGVRMSDALFDKIIDDLTAIPRSVRLTIAPFKVNEPFLDRRMIPMCRTITGRLPNARIEIFTNGSTLTETILRSLAELPSLLFLWISLNHHRPEAYRTVMGLPFDKTLARLDALHQALEAGWLTVPVKVSRVADGGPDDAAFTAFVAARYPRFEPVLVGRETWAGQVDTGSQRPPRPEGCTRWYELSIMATGEVALCCMDGMGAHVIGDVTRQSVLEVYNSPGYRALRETTRRRRDAPPPCAGCSL